MARKARLTPHDIEIKDRIRTVLEKSISSLANTLQQPKGSDVKQFVSHLTDTVDRTDLALAVSLVQTYESTDDKEVIRLRDNLLNVLEIMAEHCYSSEVGRSILKLAEKYDAHIQSKVAEDKVTRFSELQEHLEELGLSHD